MRGSALLSLLALVMLGPAAEARAVDLRFPDGRVARPYQRWTQRARVPAPSVQITVVTTGCPYLDSAEVWGCAAGTTIYLRADIRRDPFMFFHELGHAFDATTMTVAAQDAYRQITGSQGPWVGDVEERFANHYALCAMPPDRYLAAPRRVCSLIRRQAARAGLS